MRTMASGTPFSIARIGSTRPLPTLTFTASIASCCITPALACTNTRSILMSSAAKKPLRSPTVTGHRLAEAEPTDPTTTVSAAPATRMAASAPKRMTVAAIRIARSGRRIARSSGLRLRARLRDEVLGDLGAGRAPHARMAADVVERRVERADAVRHAGDVGMQSDRQHPAGRLALAIEHVEGAADLVLEFFGRDEHVLIGRLVVALLRVRHRDDLLAAVEVHHIGLVVVAPVALV